MSKFKNNNHFTIFGWMIHRLGLKDSKLIVYAIVYSFSQDGENEYYGGRKYMAEASARSLPTVDRMLVELEKDGLIKKMERQNDGVSHCRYSVFVNEDGEGIKDPNKKDSNDNTTYHGDNTPSYHGDNTNNKENIYNNKDNNKETLEISSRVKERLTHKYNGDKPLTDIEVKYYLGMEEKYPRVMRMDKPLLYGQYQELLKKGICLEKIIANLEAMENWKPLKDRVKAYQTLLTFLRKDNTQYAQSVA